MSSRFPRLILSRAAAALFLVLAVASSSLVLARLAPGDHLTGFGVDPLVAAAERKRLGYDRPVHEQYLRWAAGVVRLDFGESARFPGQPVSALVADRAGNSLLVGSLALLVATALGIPAGLFTGSRRSGVAGSATRAASLAFLATPPIVLSLALLSVALRTGWFPVGGLPPQASPFDLLRHLALPVFALALPTAAVLERLQSRATGEALAHPSLRAARARGVTPGRLLWRHAFRLSLQPVLGIYGILVGSLISGSFIVEFVLTWPGLGLLMYDALVSRDANLVAGCAAAGAAFLAFGILLSDLALALADPRTGAA